MEARDPSSSIQCDIGRQTIHASCGRDSVVNLVVAAGVLAVPGSTKQAPIRGVRVMLTGVHNLSKTTSETLKWFDSVVPDDTVVRAQWSVVPSVSEPALRRTSQEPAAIDRFLSRKLDELEDHFARDTEQGDVAVPIASDEAIQLPLSDHCLAIRRNDGPVTVIGTRWSTSVTMTLERTQDDRPVCHLKLAGFEDSTQFSWGEWPLAPLEDVEISFIGRGQPHPARIVRGIGQSGPALARAFRNELRKRYRK